MDLRVNTILITNEVEHWYVRHKYFYCLIT